MLCWSEKLEDGSWKMEVGRVSRKGREVFTQRFAKKCLEKTLTNLSAS